MGWAQERDEKLEFWQEIFLQNHQLGRSIMRWEDNEISFVNWRPIEQFYVRVPEQIWRSLVVV